MEASRVLDKGLGGFPKIFSAGKSTCDALFAVIARSTRPLMIGHFPAMREDGLDWRPNEQFRALSSGQDLGFHAAVL